MKRADRIDSDDDAPGQLRRYGENVLVCLTGLPDCEMFNRCWREGVLVGEEDANDCFLVSVHNEHMRVHRDRIQYKDVTKRPTEVGQLVLVHQMNNGGYSWWEATVRKIHPPDEVHDYPRCTVEWVGKYNHSDLQHVVLECCIVARHYTPPPEERPEKKIKKLV